ncbi:MAG TPA: TRAP transporter TatT component family protein [Bacteroidota bacterium]|nr:TRAP transporter TatT component family protein [Bacteroidota bacterium]
MRATPILLILCVMLFQGCFQQIAVGSLTGIMEDGFLVLNEESDLALAEAGIASNLKLLESVLRSEPDNDRVLLMTCRGYASYAMGFVEDADPVRARGFYRRGLDYGLRLFPPESAIGRSLRSDPAGLSDALRRASKSDVPAIFWTAVAWGSAISLDRTNTDALAELPRVEEMIAWVREKDPGYFYGGADFFLGTLKGSKPPIFGGDTAASRAHFERALEINGGKFLLTYVYYARHYAVQTLDSVLFAGLLTAVDTASIDILPEARLSNAIAKRKAVLFRKKFDASF